MGDLDVLKDGRKSCREAAVNAKDAAAGLTNVSPISISQKYQHKKLGLQGDFVGVHLFFTLFFCYKMGLRFQNLVSPVLISCLLACVGFGVGWLGLGALCILFGAALRPWRIQNTTTTCK